MSCVQSGRCTEEWHGTCSVGTVRAVRGLCGAWEPGTKDVGSAQAQLPWLKGLRGVPPLSSAPLLSTHILSMGGSRKPLERREVEIIQRMKQALHYPVAQIAAAVGRNKSTIYRALTIDLRLSVPGHVHSRPGCAMGTRPSPCASAYGRVCQHGRHVWRTPDLGTP